MSADALLQSLQLLVEASSGGYFWVMPLKKVVKLIAVVVGLFIAGLAYLQYLSNFCMFAFSVSATYMGTMEEQKHLLCYCLL